MCVWSRSAERCDVSNLLCSERTSRLTDQTSHTHEPISLLSALISETNDSSSYEKGNGRRRTRWRTYKNDKINSTCLIYTTSH